LVDQFYQPVETQFGILQGRDTIFVDAVSLTLSPGQLTLSGTINGSNASHNPTLQDFHYTFIFHQVLALKVIELDSWNWVSPSCFAQIINSQWLAQLKGKVTPDYQHYLLQTYDDVFDIVCLSTSVEMIPLQANPD
jgi:hypothetical protein